MFPQKHEAAQLFSTLIKKLSSLLDRFLKIMWHCSNAENSALQHKDKLFENILKLIIFLNCNGSY